METVKTAICCLMAIAFIGCSAKQPDTQVLRVRCNVEDTILKVNGDKYACPGEVSVRRNSKVTVEGYKDGYDKYYKEIDHHLSSSAKLDIVGTAIMFFPVFGLMSAGAWDLDETDVNVVLTEIKDTPKK